ncbi:MAG TPA: MmgE/PrpD family protein [Acetobacteraceae bacterium]|jgi:2-methylcitrate dehydratase PrpD|nr:MmgE/PrpD family protein [Acetobacteraceae bacterium]
MSLSRDFADFVAKLSYEDLPASVADRAKGVTLQALTSALLARDMPASKQALALMQEEEAGGGGIASVLCSGVKLTKAGAAFVNSEMILAGGKWDTFRMLTHPGTAILPAALVAAETTGASGQQFLTAIAAAYEVMERMAADFIPTVMARGFHAGPVFGIFGAAVAVAKLQQLDANQIHGAIAQCVNLASGNLEGIRSGGRSLREGAAVRNALLAVAMAKHGTPGGETTLEGDAGFYHAYTGNNLGRLTYSFTGRTSTELRQITEGLGQDWIFLETLYRIYSTAGYNIAHVDVTAKLCEDHGITYPDIDRIEAVVNWFETEYPSPAFPTPGSDGKPRVGSTQYFTAYGAVTRGYPLLRGAQPGPGETDPPEVLDLMQRVTLIPMVRRTLFGPRITVFTKDGRSVTREGTGREFIWDFEEQARRIQPVVSGLAITPDHFAELINVCRHLEQTDSAALRLIALTIPS